MIFVPGFAVGYIIQLIVDFMWNASQFANFEGYLTMQQSLHYFFVAVSILALLAWLSEYPTDDVEEETESIP